MIKRNFGPSYCSCCGKKTEHLLLLMLIKKKYKKCVICGKEDKLSLEDKENFKIIKKSKLLANNGAPYIALCRDVAIQIKESFNKLDPEMLKEENASMIRKQIIHLVSNNTYVKYVSLYPLKESWYTDLVDFMYTACVTQPGVNEVLRKY